MYKTWWHTNISELRCLLKYNLSIPQLFALPGQLLPPNPRLNSKLYPGKHTMHRGKLNLLVLSPVQLQIWQDISCKGTYCQKAATTSNWLNKVSPSPAYLQPGQLVQKVSVNIWNKLLLSKSPLGNRGRVFILRPERHLKSTCRPDSREDLRVHPPRQTVHKPQGNSCYSWVGFLMCFKIFFCFLKLSLLNKARQIDSKCSPFLNLPLFPLIMC